MNVAARKQPPLTDAVVTASSLESELYAALDGHEVEWDQIPVYLDSMGHHRQQVVAMKVEYICGEAQLILVTK